MISDHSIRYQARPAEHGFSMIEVLVTLLIISLALLGTAGLQAYSMRLNQGGQFRSLAVFLAADLAERMEANKAAATAGSYVVTSTTGAAYLAGAAATSSACVTGACSAAALATYDLSQWQSAVAATLPQSSWSIALTQSASGTQTRSDYTVTIGWVDRSSNTTNAATNANSAVGGNAAGTGEKFSYTASRTIFN
jgi:type IV pilus assembly protein PilV